MIKGSNGINTYVVDSLWQCGLSIAAKTCPGSGPERNRLQSWLPRTWRWSSDVSDPQLLVCTVQIQGELWGLSQTAHGEGLAQRQAGMGPSSCVVAAASSQQTSNSHFLCATHCLRPEHAEVNKAWSHGACILQVGDVRKRYTPWWERAETVGAAGDQSARDGLLLRVCR